MTSRRQFLRIGTGALAIPFALRNAAAAVDASDVAAAGAAQEALAAAGLETKAAGVTSVVSLPGILLEDSASGVARDYYHYRLKLPWRGSFEGATIGTGSAKSTGLVRITMPKAPEILVLRAAGSWVNVYSRESGNGPQLQVVYTDGTSGVLACLADSTIDSSSALPIGYDTRVQLGNTVALMRFEVATKPVASAALVFQAYSMGAAATFEVHDFKSPLLPAPSPVYGLRSRGLTGPTLIHNTNFGAANWWYPFFTTLSAMPTAATAANQIVDTDQDTLVPLGRKAYMVEVRPAGMPPRAGPMFPESPAYVFPKNIGKELEEVYFQYRLRFGEGWRGGSMQSGKLPGIASDTTVAGNGGAQSNGRNGWSFRGLFVGEPFDTKSPYNSNNGIVPVGWYTYNPDQITQNEYYGIHLPWTGRGSLGLLEVGKDYWIDQYIKVNTPGKRDGIVRAWINGQLVYERTDHIMRDVGPYAVPGNLAINKVWMTFLHGGDVNPLPTKILRTYWSDWTIASEYIGPPTGTGTAGPTISLAAPVANATIASGAALGMTATVTPGGAPIAKVDFLCDGNVLATKTAAPFTASLAGIANGQHVVMAVATDTAGGVAYSSPVTVTVGVLANQAPSVTIACPLEGSKYTTKSSIPFRVYATDDGSVSSVKFYLGNFVIASWMNGVSPYASTFGGFSAGTYTFKVVATDNQGVTSTKTSTFTVT